MSERFPDTQIEALVGATENCQDIDVTLGNLLGDGDFDVVASVKDTRRESAEGTTKLEWPTVLPEYNQKVLIGAGSVVDIVKANQQKNSLIQSGIKLEVRRTSRVYEPRFLISDEAVILTPAQAWRQKLIGNSQMSIADKNIEEEKSEQIRIRQALDMGPKDFVEHVEFETLSLVEELNNGHFAVPTHYQEAVIASLADVAEITADQIYSSLRDLETSIVDSKAFMAESLSSDLRVFVESSHDVSKDIYIKDKQKLQLMAHLGNLGVTKIDRLHALFNFVNPDGSNLDLPKLAGVMDLYRPDHIIGTRFHLLPTLGKVATVVAGYNHFGRNINSNTPLSTESDRSPRQLTDQLETWNEDVRYISNREGLSPNAKFALWYIEDFVNRGEIEVADLGTKKSEVVLPLGSIPTALSDLERQQEETNNKAYDYTNAPSIFVESDTAQIQEEPEAIVEETIVQPVKAPEEIAAENLEIEATQDAIEEMSPSMPEAISSGDADANSTVDDESSSINPIITSFDDETDFRTDYTYTPDSDEEDSQSDDDAPISYEDLASDIEEDGPDNTNDTNNRW